MEPDGKSASDATMIFEIMRRLFENESLSEAVMAERMSKGFDFLTSEFGYDFSEATKKLPEGDSWKWSVDFVKSFPKAFEKAGLEGMLAAAALCCDHGSPGSSGLSSLVLERGWKSGYFETLRRTLVRCDELSRAESARNGEDFFLRAGDLNAYSLLSEWLSMGRKTNRPDWSSHGTDETKRFLELSFDAGLQYAKVGIRVAFGGAMELEEAYRFVRDELVGKARHAKTDLNAFFMNEAKKKPQLAKLISEDMCSLSSKVELRHRASFEFDVKEVAKRYGMRYEDARDLSFWFSAAATEAFAETMSRYGGKASAATEGKVVFLFDDHGGAQAGSEILSFFAEDGFVRMMDEAYAAKKACDSKEWDGVLETSARRYALEAVLSHGEKEKEQYLGMKRKI